MATIRGYVRNGRIVVDEPTDLPEGSEVELVRADQDEMSDDERAELDRVLIAAIRSAREGYTVDADDVLAELGETT